MKNSLRSIAIVITLIITLNGTALAAPTNEDLKQKRIKSTPKNTHFCFDFSGFTQLLY